MPKLKVYDGSPAEEGTVALRLVQVSPEEVLLAAVDSDGEILIDETNDYYGGGLLTLTENGNIALSPGVMPSLGFETGTEDRLMLDAYAEQMTAQRAIRTGGGGKEAAIKRIK